MGHEGWFLGPLLEYSISRTWPNASVTMSDYEAIREAEKTREGSSVKKNKGGYKSTKDQYGAGFANNLSLLLLVLLCTAALWLL